MGHWFGDRPYRHNHAMPSTPSNAATRDGLAQCAYGDESFQEADTGGYYVVAAAVFKPGGDEAAREALTRLHRRRAGKLHWNEMDSAEQRTVVKHLAALEALHLVTVGGPVPPRRQERARARCLHQLVLELHGYGVERLLLESRTRILDARDVKTVQGARFALPKGSRFVIDHAPGPTEPLLWAADVVAGAVRAQRQGDPEYRTLLEHCVYEIEVDTGC